MVTLNGLPLCQGQEAAPAPVVHVHVLDVLRINQLLSSRDGGFRLEGMTLPQEPTVQLSAPDEPVAEIQDLACRFGDSHGEGTSHDLVLCSRFFPLPISHSSSPQSQPHSDGPLPPFQEVTLW